MTAHPLAIPDRITRQGPTAAATYAQVRAAANASTARILYRLARRARPQADASLLRDAAEWQAIAAVDAAQARDLAAAVR